MSAHRRPSLAPAFALAAAPFYLNDFANLHVQDWRWWLFIDYVVVKVPPLLIAAWLVRTGGLTLADLGIRREPAARLLAAAAVLGLAGTLIDQNAYRLIADLPGYPPLGAMPAIASPAWRWIDLTFGLALVGLLEELVFRAFLARVLRDLTSSAAATVGVSAVAFGLIHWSNGLHSVLVTAVIGAVLMAGYLRTRSLAAVVIAHFAINFVDFAGVIPKSLFRLV